MLEELTVRNFGIIEAVTWQPGTGFNVITGETGAGKSLVVDAVDALLSGQVKEEDIRHGADAAQVGGVFRTTGNGALHALLEEKGLDGDDDSLLLSCDFRRQGRTVPRVNRQAVSRSVLRDIGAAIVDIHGQSEHLSLLRTDHHLDFLDAFAGTERLREEFGERFSELGRLERELVALSRDDAELARRIDLLNYQIDEIDRAGLHDGEEEELVQELALLNSAEKLKATAYDIYSLLYGDDGMSSASAAIEHINEALPLLRGMTGTDPSLQVQATYLEEVLAGLEELARDIRAYGDNLAFDPERLEEVQGRLELIRSLKRKYGASIPEILSFAEQAQAELAGLTDSGERRQTLKTEIESLRQELGGKAARLSGERTGAAAELSTAVGRELADLGMGRVEFSVRTAKHAAETGIPFPDGTCYAYSATGADDVTFMASTNPGEPLKPLEKIASTGEISRFLLALKSALAEADTTPVLIFDEIDIGVGGRSGEVIGRKLWDLSRHHQVICVTHLPQIAAFADQHFTVSKEAAGERTVSSLRALEEADRPGELAAMLAGPDYKETALKTARDLIEKAADWKEKSGA